MNQHSEMFPGMTIGIDLGDRHSWYCCLDQSGQVTKRGRVSTTPEAFRKLFGALPPARIALEVGTHSGWASRELASGGHEVLVSNARKLALVYGDDHKSDQIDAEKLARLARIDPHLLHPIRHRSAQAQADLAVLRARHALVETRTRLVNLLRGMLKSHGRRARSCSAKGFHRQVGAVVPDELRPALAPLIEMLTAIAAQIRCYDNLLEQLCEERYPETERLRQVHGVGPITALGFVLTLEDPHRFSRSRTVGAFLGLSPRTWQSGSLNRPMRITKAGDEDLRRWLVGSAQYVLGPFGVDCDLRRYGERLHRRGGRAAKKRAVVAVARKLAVLLHRLWITGEPYEPLRLAQRTRVATTAA